MSVRVLCAATAFACLLSSCAGKPPSEGGSLKTAFAAGNATGPLQAKDDANSPVALTPAAWGRMNNPGGLSGRTLTVNSLADLKLRNKEVVLTFDDGPVPKKTERILATLDDFKVKATFLMVGEMAKAYPKIARQVVDAGHTVGSHTFRHADLRKLAVDEAIAEINRGRDAVRLATRTDTNFFRFPYLSDSGTLRHWVAQNRMVVLDVQIDSKDYFGVSPAAVATRTMSELHRHGRGIILMHDIHNRTGAMLPALLTQLKAEGYKVVTLRYGGSRGPMLSAALERDADSDRS
ncbi:peptidoglycan/xylan/chitin deacetylase (PgdA/CDA1 family) [Neorhizobium huautlense]|uniref:Chitooligosaccharide deacetylase n=1 Tax=Neorhizobium huautlense TaxID=67774 RepID=A0ABT9PX94_9HYPH|nr:polysaccharide deacetylase family protein [Neorhizobium huautlense]MDP9839099.1 peptidoglycan/xylan/chitin deacetylase (PgdA/CDA1 family) [Neorhizobium huautlense]